MLNPTDYQILVEQAPILIWRAGTDKGCDYFNARWLAFTGRTLEEEVGHGWAEGVHPEDFERCLAIYTSSFDRREVFEMTYRLRRHDGCYRWLFDRGVPFFGEDGRFAGYIGSCVDVTDKVEAEAALAASRARELEELDSLLPVCAWCRKIRSDDGYWRELEEYVSKRRLGQVTHGICAECASRLEQSPSVAPTPECSLG